MQFPKSISQTAECKSLHGSQMRALNVQRPVTIKRGFQEGSPKKGCLCRPQSAPPFKPSVVLGAHATSSSTPIATKHAVGLLPSALVRTPAAAFQVP